MSSEIQSLYQDIRSNLDLSRKAIIKTSLLGDDASSNIRELGEAGFVLDTLEYIAVETRSLVDTHPSLESLFERPLVKSMKSSIEKLFLRLVSWKIIFFLLLKPIR